MSMHLTKSIVYGIRVYEQMAKDIQNYILTQGIHQSSVAQSLDKTLELTLYSNNSGYGENKMYNEYSEHFFGVQYEPDDIKNGLTLTPQKVIDLYQQAAPQFLKSLGYEPYATKTPETLLLSQTM